MSDDDLEARLRRLEEDRPRLDHHGMPPMDETPLPIKAPPMSPQALAKQDHDRKRWLEAKAAADEAQRRELEERRLEDERRRDPAYLKAEIAEFDDELSRLATDTPPVATQSGMSWEARDANRRHEQNRTARMGELRIRRERSLADLAAAESWQRNAPARKAALAELPDAQRILDKLQDEFQLVQGEYLQALHRVRQLQETASQ